MKYLDKIYNATLFILFTFCFFVFIRPDYFSLSFVIISFTLLIIVFYVINHKYKKMNPQKKNYNFFGYTLFVMSSIYLTYTLVRYFNR